MNTKLLDQLQAGEIKMLAVAVRLPGDFGSPAAATVNYTSAAALQLVLSRGLALAGVEACGDAEHGHVSTEWTHNLAFFYVRDVASAAVVIREDLELLKLWPFCSIAYLDQRERYWRAVEQGSGLIEPHAFITQLLADESRPLQQCQLAQQFITDSLARLKPST